jgi:hypothetical protein
MKTLSQKLLTGLLTIAVLTCLVGVAQAWPPPHPWPHPTPHPWPHPTPHPWPHPTPHPWPHPTPHPSPWYLPRPYPVVIADYVDDSNPVPADIQLSNPARNRVALRYSLNDGEIRSLPAGSSVQINQAAVITFDRGGGIGRARYSLTDGAYKFVPAGGAWTLVRQTTQVAETSQVAGAGANPVPGE